MAPFFLQSSEGTAVENPTSPVPSPATSSSRSEREEPPAKRKKSCGSTQEERAAELLEQRTVVLARMAQCMETPTLAPDDCSAFGTVVAGHIRHMSVPDRAECQAAILALITDRLQGYK